MVANILHEEPSPRPPISGSRRAGKNGPPKDGGATRRPQDFLDSTKGVPRNGGRKKQLAWSCSDLSSLHVEALVSTDVQTPFLGTPLSSP